jgi:uncharacterized protein with HEPN domain
MRDDRERLLDLQEAIDRIGKYAARGREAFVQDELIQYWMVHHLLIIGEAVRALSAEFRAPAPGMAVDGRHWHAQHSRSPFFDIDTDIVWSVVTNDLPELKNRVEAALREPPISAP